MHDKNHNKKTRTENNKKAGKTTVRVYEIKKMGYNNQYANINNMMLESKGILTL
jgi:hypothetical protein